MKDCLTLLQTKTQGQKCVVVVDNGSTDGSVEMIEREFTWVKLTKNKRNSGFAKAVNQGIYYSLCEGARAGNRARSLQHISEQNQESLDWQEICR